MTRNLTHSTLWLGAFLSVGACHYDLDSIFQAGETLAPPVEEVESIAEFLGGRFSTVGDECHACAVKECDEVNQACLADEECVAYNRCIGQSTDPATQAECRAEFVTWLSKDIAGRDVGGPYQQCVFQDRCSDACGARDNWECVGKFSWPTTPVQSIPYRIRFVQALGEGAVVAGMQVKVCRPDDLACAQPTSTATTDEKGEVQLDLKTTLRTFQGYLELSREDIYPTLVRLAWPIAQEGITNIAIIDSKSVKFNIDTAGVEPDPERGLLQVRFFSCAGLTAPGVSFKTQLTDEASRIWYADRIGLPDFKGESTSNIGAGGIINSVQGLHHLEATLGPGGPKIAEARAPVRGGYMTIVLFSPLPSN